MEQYNIDRIEKLREKAKQPEYSFEGAYYLFFGKYAVNEDLGFREERYADAYLYTMSNIKPVISEGELIVGKPSHFLGEAEKAEWKKLEGVREDFAVRCGQESHMAVDYELLLREGTSGVARIIESLKQKTTDSEKLRYYSCCQSCLRGVEILSERYAAFAESSAVGCADEKRREELLNIAEICRKVPRLPALSFYEAVQSVSFLTYCLSFDPSKYFCAMQYQLGRIDRYLLPFYERDIAKGTLTDEKAQLLIDCLAIQINNRVPRGLSSGYMVGGRNARGEVVANRLTEMGMQAVEDIRLVYPSVGYCYTKDSPEYLLHKACEILSHGRSHPAIFNDDLISEGLRYYGVSESESHEYIHSTCVEITPVASSGIWVASPYHNTVRYLLDVLDREYESMDELLEAYFAHLDERIISEKEVQREYKKQRAERGIHPLVSCFVNNCLEKCRDIDRSGAGYEWVMPSFVGIANTVDSLEVIRKVIFEEKKMTFARLKALLNSDFEENEALRLYFLNGIAKYGNDIENADRLFGVITGHIADFIKELNEKNDGIRLVPSAFCWIMHEHFGRETGATPDGRPAGFPLGDGSGPCQGREHNGPTASILSSTGWNHLPFIGGVAVNMKFPKHSFTVESCKKAETLIKTYMARGGFEIQINVVDRDTLLAAQKNPEAYSDLVVRIGGYSDYFVCLSPEMQAEVLLRTEHNI